MAKAELITQLTNIKRLPKGGRFADFILGHAMGGSIKVRPTQPKRWWHGLAERNYEGYVYAKGNNSGELGPVTARTGRSALRQIRNAYNNEQRKNA